MTSPDENHYKLPDGHRQFNDFSHHMSLDETNNLYWHGKKIKTELSVPQSVKKFGIWVGVFAILASLSTIVNTALSIHSFINPTDNRVHLVIERDVLEEADISLSEGS